MRAIPPFGLRMQQSLRDALLDAARANGRSLNSEIVQRLLDSFSADIGQRKQPRRERPSQDALTPPEQLLLVAFRGMKPEVQLGLVAFLRGLR